MGTTMTADQNRIIKNFHYGVLLNREAVQLLVSTGMERKDAENLLGINKTHPSRPGWTVVYNIVSPEDSAWVGTGWEFFNDEVNAESCRLRHQRAGNVPTKRPYHENDGKHLGAAHR